MDQWYHAGSLMEQAYHGGGAADGGSADFSDQMCLWDWQTGEHCEPRNWQAGEHCEPRNWQTGEHCEPRDGSHDATKFLWDRLNQDDDELVGLHGNQTPLRDCCDFFDDLGDIACKEILDLEESRESKRRRTLEYPSEFSQSVVGSHETGSPFVTSEEVSMLCTNEPVGLNFDTQYTSNNLDRINSVSNEAPYEQEDNHLERCSYGTPVYVEPNQVPYSQGSIAYVDDQADISGTSEIAPVTESFIMQETRKLSTLEVSKSASAVEVKQNLTTSVAKLNYPFTLIKPSWGKGDVTLKDINQRSHAPQKKAREILGTSAFFGKPVNDERTIRIQGGRSITIQTIKS